MAEKQDVEGPTAPADQDDSGFLERVMRYLEDDLSADSAAVLRNELAADPRKRDIFALICISDTLAHEEMPAMRAANTIGDDPSESVIPGSGEQTLTATMNDTMILPAITPETGESSGNAAHAPGHFTATAPTSRNRRWIKWGSYATVMLAAIALFLPRHLRVKKAVAATLTLTYQAHWASAASGPPVDGQLLVGQILDLQSGCAQFLFAHSTRFTAEGPTRLQFIGPNSVELMSGKASVQLQPGQSGFIVVTPDCKVTDLGTEFGVKADAVTQSTDVHVFGGRVEITANSSAAAPSTVGMGGLAHVALGTVRITPDASLPQLFVQDLAKSTSSLELADILCGGDGTAQHRGGVIDPGTGSFGIWGALDPWYNMATTAPVRDDGSYHLTRSLPMLDGCFIPNGKGLPQQVDSAGDRITCPTGSGASTLRICVPGSVAPVPGGKTIAPREGDTNFSLADHSYVMLCPDVGLTLNLAAIRRVHPTGQLTRFRCKFGNFGTAGDRSRADFVVLVDGVSRFCKTSFTAGDGVMSVVIPLTTSNRFLTLITTDDGNPGLGDHIFIGDAFLDQIQKD
jgi:hypothetical protein